MIAKAGDLLRTARHSAGLSQRQLARRARIPQPTIAAIERGRQDPRYATLTRLVRACGFDLVFANRPGEVDRSIMREQLRRTPGERSA